MKVSAVVVSHGHAAELERSLHALASQVDEIVVVANVPGSVGALPPGVRVIENATPERLAANVNRRDRRHDRRARPLLQPGCGGRAGSGRSARGGDGRASPLRHRGPADAVA